MARPFFLSNGPGFPDTLSLPGAQVQRLPATVAPATAARLISTPSTAEALPLSTTVFNGQLPAIISILGLPAVLTGATLTPC